MCIRDSGKGVHIVHDAILMDAVEEVHIRKAVVQRLAERNGLDDDEADDPGDQVEQALPFVKKLLGRGTPESCLLYTSYLRRTDPVRRRTR